MEEARVEEMMFNLAIAIIKDRYPIGWGGAAVIHTAQNSYFTSVAIETENASAGLCIETGAICEAHKYNEQVTHCLCVVREDEMHPFRILTPCGICQERLRFFGEDVLVGVTNSRHKLKYVPLKELQPYHWSKAYK